MTAPVEFPYGVKIGGVSIVPTQGTRGADKRLRFQADPGNSCELELVPGEGCDPRGVQTQIQLFAVQRPTDLGYARVDISIVGNSDGIGEDCIIDSTSSGGRKPITIIVKMGGDATKTPSFGGFTAMKIFGDGTVFGYKADGSYAQLSAGADKG